MAAAGGGQRMVTGGGSAGPGLLPAGFPTACGLACRSRGAHACFFCAEVQASECACTLMSATAMPVIVGPWHLSCEFRNCLFVRLSGRDQSSRSMQYMRSDPCRAGEVPWKSRMYKGQLSLGTS